MEIAVFDANAPPSLAFVRSLGRQGIAADVYSAEPWSIAGASRYCRRRRKSPPLSDYDRFRTFLENEIQLGNISAIAPTSDLVCFYLSCVLDKLAPECRRVLPDAESLRHVLFKDRFVPRGDGRIQPPKTFCPRSVEEAHDLAESFVYPCVLKPRSHIATPAERGHVARDPQEFRRFFRRANVPDSAAAVLDAFPELALPVVQEFIPSRPSDLVTISGFLDENGECLAMLGAKKTAQWPPRLGIGLLFEVCPIDAFRDEVTAFVRDRVGRGIFELELIPRDDGRHIALDLNPRGYGQMQFDIARGNDYPAMWAATFQGRSRAVVESFARPTDTVIRYAHGVPLAARAIARSMRRGHMRWALASFRKDAQGAVGVMHDDSDPLPTAIYLGSMLRHPGGLIRPFLTRKPVNPLKRRAAERPLY